MSTASRTILIVEDNAQNMTLFSELLKKNGYETIQSVDGKDALELARAHCPNLIIMDIQLPGVSGLDRTKMLKADEDVKHIPVLAVTAFTLEGGLERILEAGCDDAMGKPISIPDFLETVARYF